MLLPIIAFSVVFLIIIFDIHLVYMGGFKNSISWRVWTLSVKYPIIPAATMLIVGVLVGHFYWNLEALIIFPVGVLTGHFFWDQSLNVTVKGARDQ